MLSFRILVFVFFLAFVESTKMRQEAGEIGRKGRFVYTYDEDVVNDPCESVVMIGVGTAMRCEDYSILAQKISTDSSIVTVIFDHNAGNIVKYGAKDYAHFYQEFTKDLGSTIPICQGKSPTIITGGHSASGRGGLQAMMHEGIQPDGFIGLDPYQASKDQIWGIGPIGAPATRIDPDLPVLSWGFEQRTCGANVDIAGKSSYNLSGVAHRVFFRANNDKQKSESSSQIGHCEFTNQGCGLLPGCPKSDPNNSDMKDVVARSIRVFVQGVVHGSINPDDFQFDTSNDTVEFDVFVNSDQVVEPTASMVQLETE